MCDRMCDGVRELTQRWHIVACKTQRLGSGLRGVIAGSAFVISGVKFGRDRGSSQQEEVEFLM